MVLLLSFIEQVVKRYHCAIIDDQRNLPKVLRYLQTL